MSPSTCRRSDATNSWRARSSWLGGTRRSWERSFSMGAPRDEWPACRHGANFVILALTCQTQLLVVIRGAPASMQTLIVLFRLKPGTDVGTYEAWARSTD